MEYQKIEFHFLDLIPDVQIECSNGSQTESKRIAYFFLVRTQW